MALIVKLHKWTESAMFFDGSSMALQVATIVIYLTIHIQSLRTFRECCGTNDHSYLPSRIFELSGT